MRGRASASLPELTAAAERPAAVLRLERESIVPAPVQDAFQFFSNAANLERLTPPWLNFRILTPQPISMRAGTEIDYQIVLYGIAIPWRTRIDVWEPGVRFVDRQLAGPYRWWLHEHRFEPAGSGTRVTDVVEYLPRVRWVSAWFVQRDLARIFEYRRQALESIFKREPPAAT